jgi:hypothetical protein
MENTIKQQTEYKKIHNWIRKRLFKPLICPYCHKKKKLVLGNISGKYKKLLKDWEWLCPRCHRWMHRIWKHKKPTKYTQYLYEEAPRYQRKYKKRIHQYNQKYLPKWRKENKEYDINYKEEHREELNRKAKERRLNNPKKHKMWAIKSYKKNRDKILIRQKKYGRIITQLKNKYKEEFDMILRDGITKNPNQYKSNYNKAKRCIKNRHIKEYLELIR